LLQVVTVPRIDPIAGKMFGTRYTAEPLKEMISFLSNFTIGSRGGLGCSPWITFLQMLHHGSNLIETSAADGSSAGNTRHLLHRLGQSTKQAVLRFLTEFFFKDVDA
jgi:hypothetical protein